MKRFKSLFRLRPFPTLEDKGQQRRTAFTLCQNTAIGVATGGGEHGEPGPLFGSGE